MSANSCIPRLITIVSTVIILMTVGCKKSPAPGSAAFDLNSTSLPGFHRFSSTINNYGAGDPTIYPFHTIQRFNIIVVDGKTILLGDVGNTSYDTLRLDASNTSTSTMVFTSPNPNPGLQPGQGDSRSTTITFYINNGNILFSDYFRSNYSNGGNYYWNISAHDTNVSTPTSLLQNYSSHISGTRSWLGNENLEGIRFYDNVVFSFAINVVDDSTLAGVYIGYPDSKSVSQGSVSEPLLLNYISSNSAQQSITFASNYYPLGGGYLVYFYVKDSISYNYSYNESGGYTNYYLHTQ